MKYIANPVQVEAHRIIEVGDYRGDSEYGARRLKLDDGQEFEATDGMLARMTPVAGDYVVIQEDGYTYLNPKDVFLRKYSLGARKYNALDHSIVQVMAGSPGQQYEAEDFHKALLFAIAREIGRVHLNRYQETWDRWGDDPKIPGIHWRQFQEDCDCPEDGGVGADFHPSGDLVSCPHGSPNFQFEDVSFNWYKYPGRGMSVSKDMPPSEWVDWFNRCLAKIGDFDVKPGRLSRAV